MKSAVHLSWICLILQATVNVECRVAPKIVNGENVTPGKYPYMASMRIANTSQHSCGGSIVSSQHVLTAAHCVKDFSTRPREIFLVTGSISTLEGGERHDVKEIRVHEKYVGASDRWQNDVAVLKLAKPLAFNAFTQILPLATKNVTADTRCVVSGWGYTHPGSWTSPTIMQTLNQTIVDEETCRNSHSELESVTGSQLCAFTAPAVGVCQGDSGGPLVCDGEQHGVVSWGILCAQGIPDVYARVGVYAQWIKERIQDVDKS